MPIKNSAQGVPGMVKIQPKIIYRYMAPDKAHFAMLVFGRF
jgi:hypothetical protein